MYRHAGIDIYLSRRGQGHGPGTGAVSLLARFLFEQRGHHRLTIDPGAANHRAIRCYEKVGFRRVGGCASMSAVRTGGSTTACYGPAAAGLLGRPDKIPDPRHDREEKKSA